LGAPEVRRRTTKAREHRREYTIVQRPINPYELVETAAVVVKCEKGAILT
jgi:hypothetical protein